LTLHIKWVHFPVFSTNKTHNTKNYILVFATKLQEVDRILSEIDEYWKVVVESGGEWIALDGMASLLANDLGYEDQGEFEDAIHGTLPQFLQQFPHIEIKVNFI
jgi:hypothetical protein